MTAIAIAVVLCFCVVNVSCYVVSNGLSQGGSHVCSRAVSRRVAYQARATRTTYRYSTTGCGWFGWWRCTRYRAVTAYYTTTAYRTEYGRELFCCSGWRRNSRSSRYCSIPICNSGCVHGHCSAPNRCTCRSGWVGSTCNRDIDECASNNGGCQQSCTNYGGGFTCGCNSGYRASSSSSCVDINECQASYGSLCICLNSIQRGCTATCQNTLGSYKCECSPGFQLTGATVCTDTDECISNNGGCNQKCYNNIGSFYCGCNSVGYQLGQDNRTCHDVDECALNNGLCEQHCKNLQGSYKCHCRYGFLLDSNGHTCSARDFCQGYHGCAHICNNFHGSYSCSCRQGYKLKPNNRSCTDVDECSPVSVPGTNLTTSLAGCDHNCSNSVGSFTCSCERGFLLQNNGKRCKDIDECKSNRQECGQVCHNTIGSYACSCYMGYVLAQDLKTCRGLPCEHIEAPPNGKMFCSGLTTNETCRFTCNPGFNHTGSPTRRCLPSLKWSGDIFICKAMQCPVLSPPPNSEVPLFCNENTIFGSSCQVFCQPGYYGNGDGKVSCNVIQDAASVSWIVGNFSCQAVRPCNPNPCLHNGLCAAASNIEPSCDCANTGYKGDRCHIGIVHTPCFPKLKAGVETNMQTVLAHPTEDLTIVIEANEQITFNPSNTVELNNTRYEVNLSVLAKIPGICLITYRVDGSNKNEFQTPKGQPIYVGLQDYPNGTIFNKLSLVYGELPEGQHQHDKKDPLSCKITLHSTAPWENKERMEFRTTGVVIVKSIGNISLPLSLVGVDSNALNLSQDQVLKSLIDRTSKTATVSGTELYELLQNDSFAISLMQEFSKLSPCWLTVRGLKNDTVFSVYNTFGSVSNPLDAPISCMRSELPFLPDTSAAFYCPQIATEISIDQDKLQFPTKSISCLAVDLCHAALFLGLSETGAKYIKGMQLLQNMKSKGWELEVRALGLSGDGSLHRNIQGLVWNGLRIISIATFPQNIWLRGNVNVVASSTTGLQISLRLKGEAVIGVKHVDKIFVKGLEDGLNASIKAEKADFNVSLQALGQAIDLKFSAENVVGKAYFGGKEYSKPQGLFFRLDGMINPWKNSPLTRILKHSSKRQPLYCSVFYKIRGGKQIGFDSASGTETQRELRLLQNYILPSFRRTLEEIDASVPEIKPKLARWFGFVNDFSFAVSKTIQLLNKGTNNGDVMQFSDLSLSSLQCSKKDLENKVQFAKEMANVLELQLSTYPTANAIPSLVTQIKQFKHDLPKLFPSLKSKMSPTQQELKGVAFTMTTNYCVNRLCFDEVNATIEHGTEQINRKIAQLIPSQIVSVDHISILFEGTVKTRAKIGRILSIRNGEKLFGLINRYNDHLMTLFRGKVDLLGIENEVMINVTDGVLGFQTAGRIHKKYCSDVNVKAKTDAWNWDSLIYHINGRMNQTTELAQLFEDKALSYTRKIVSEALASLNISKGALIKARTRRQTIEDISLRQQENIKDAMSNKEEARHRYLFAKQLYDWAKEDFVNPLMNYLNDSNSYPCQLMQCNKTRNVNVKCIVELVQEKANTGIYTRDCEGEKTVVYEEVIRQVFKKKSYLIPTWDTYCQTNCGGRVFRAFVGAIVCGLTCFKAGLSGAFGGCSEKCTAVPGPPIEKHFIEAQSYLENIPRVVTEYKCVDEYIELPTNGHGAVTGFKCKPGSGFRTLDSSCLTENMKCIKRQHNFGTVLENHNKTLFEEFKELQMKGNKVDSEAIKLKLARKREEFAWRQVNLTNILLLQLRSAETLALASFNKANSLNKEGLELASHLVKSSGSKLITVESIEFNLLTSSGTNTRFPVVVSAVSYAGVKKTIEVVIDFEKVQRSVSIAIKRIVGPLLSKPEPLRSKRSVSVSSFNMNVTINNNDDSECTFVTNANSYFDDVVESLVKIIEQKSKLQEIVSSDTSSLETVINEFVGSKDTLNTFTLPSNNSHVIEEYIRMLQTFKSLHQEQLEMISWNETLMAWRGSLEILTYAKKFYGCSGTENCFNYFFNGLADLYEYEDDVKKGSEIKKLIPELKLQLFGLIQDNFTADEGVQRVDRLKTLLNKTKDGIVLCGQKPEILESSPLDMTVVEGSTVILFCKGVSDTPMKVKWRKNRKEIPKQTNFFLKLTKVKKSDEAAYVCEIVNRKGFSVSNVTIVRIEEKPNITKNPENLQFIRGSDKPFTFSCNATGTPRPTFQWYVLFRNSTQPTRLINRTKPFLFKTSAVPDDEGLYFCEASNVHGTAQSKEARLDVLKTTIAIPLVGGAMNITLVYEHNRSSKPCNDTYANKTCKTHEQNVTLPHKLNEDLEAGIKQGLVQSFNISSAILHSVKYEQTSLRDATVRFALGTNEPFKSIAVNSSFKYIANHIDKTRRSLSEILIGLHNDTVNNSFIINWNNTTLTSSPGSFRAFVPPPQCDRGQELYENWIVCVNCPPGTFENNTSSCMKCPKGTYQPWQGQNNCFPCAENHTTLHNGSTEISECVIIETSTAGSTTLPEQPSNPSEPNDKPTTASSLSEEPTSPETMEIYCVARKDSISSQKEWSSVTDMLCRKLEESTKVSYHTFKSSHVKVTKEEIKVTVLLPNNAKEKLVPQLVNKQVEFSVHGVMIKCSTDASGSLGARKETSKAKEEKSWMIWAAVAAVGLVFLIAFIGVAVLCYRRRKTPKSPTENKRSEQYNNEAYEDIYDEPTVPPKHTRYPPNSPVGPQQFDNETYGIASYSQPGGPPVVKTSQPAEYENDKPQPEQGYYNASEENIYEELPLSAAKAPPTKDSAPPDYEHMVRYQNLEQPTKIGTEETEA